MLRVRDIGSHMLGEKSYNLSELFAMLTKYPLNPLFEDYGNFCYKLCPEDAKQLGCLYHFFGNFYEHSFGFDICADTKADTVKLERAIRRNQKTPEYIAAWSKHQAQKRAEAKRIKELRKCNH